MSRGEVDPRNPYFEEDKEGFLGRMGSDLRGSAVIDLPYSSESEVKDSSLRGFVKFREWKTWSKSKPSSPKKDSNLMTGSQGNTVVSPSGEFLIDGLSPGKWLKCERAKGENLILSSFPVSSIPGKPSCDRVSFRSPSPDPKAFWSVESSSENIHRWRLFWRTFPGNVFFPTPQGAPGGDLQFFPKHRSQKTTHAPAIAFFRPATAPHVPAREGALARASFGVLLPPPALRTVFPASSGYFFSTPILHVPWEVFFYLSDGATAKGLYTNDIQRLYKVAFAIIHINQRDLDLSTYIGKIASLKEFLTVIPLTPDVWGPCRNAFTLGF
ncbi:hypothetical protein CK203_062242 [Vitis vinifera]|uniref:Uncharacterized protein n=1 Tax=Vitis vinifera TaxID=29760 RepID=A0A438G9C8_VITVI|nr:hypothetical protein CK203_062242 [Vitis vinifera]